MKIVRGNACPQEYMGRGMLRTVDKMSEFIPSGKAVIDASVETARFTLGNIAGATYTLIGYTMLNTFKIVKPFCKIAGCKETASKLDGWIKNNKLKTSIRNFYSEFGVPKSGEAVTNTVDSLSKNIGKLTRIFKKTT